MPQVISDARIAAMIAEPKRLPPDWQRQLAALKARPGRDESQVDFTGADGTAFRIIVSQRHRDRSDFSLILLAILDPSIAPGKPEFRLLRYDGPGHPHTNTIEGNTINQKPHIHRATERYQIATGHRRPDGYAEETRRYQDLTGAWECFRLDVGLRFPQARNQVITLPAPFTEG